MAKVGETPFQRAIRIEKRIRPGRWKLRLSIFKNQLITRGFNPPKKDIDNHFRKMIWSKSFPKTLRKAVLAYCRAYSEDVYAFFAQNPYKKG